MKKWSIRFLRWAYVGLIACLPVAAIANYTATQGAGTNFGSVVIGGVHFMSQLLCDATTANQCAAVSAGGALSVALAANQSVNEAQINGVTPLMGNGVTGTGSQRVTIASDNTAFAVNSTLTAETTKNIGTIRVTGNVGGVLDAIGQNVTAPANWLQAGCQFQTTPTTITATNGSPCQMDNAGNLLVNVKTATGLAQGSTTSGQTGSMIMGAVTTGDPAYTTAQTAYASLDVKGHVRTVLGGGVPETISATGTTAATTATLATGAAVTTYICGFSIRANATAAATGNATVTGVITGTMNFTQWTAPNASGVGVTEEVFVPCIPASAANTTIAVVSAAPGTGGVVSVSAWGYQQ